MDSPKLVVAICGGGIGGLTAAIALARLSSERKDIQVDLYEAVGKFTEVGAGVGMFPRPWNIMKNLGIDKELRKLDNMPKEGDPPGLVMQLHKSDQPRDLVFYEIEVNPGLLRFHRAMFQRCLANQLDEETTSIHFSKRLASYSLPSSSSPDSSITLHFIDGTKANCDVLIGADGIHSPTRHTLCELAAQAAEARGSADDIRKAAELRMLKEPVWSGTFAYRALIPFEKLMAVNPNHGALRYFHNYMGRSRHVAAYPISHLRVINFVGFCTYAEKEGTRFDGLLMEERPQQELREQYKGWDEEVQQLIQCVERPIRWAVHAVRPLTQYTHDRVALIGDAAHAMLPQQGSGAGQAIEDAYVLASLLADPNTNRVTLPLALSIYDGIRRPFGTNVQTFSRNNRQLYDFVNPRLTEDDLAYLASLSGPHLQEVGDNGDAVVQKLWETGDAIRNDWTWAWDSDPEEDRKRALTMLQQGTSGTVLSRL